MTVNERRMNAEAIIQRYMKAIYGYSLKRTADFQDAEDLTQEIIWKLYKALLAKDDIENTEGYVWRVAHNVFSNYYRGKSKQGILVDINDLSDSLAFDGESPEEIAAEKDTVSRLKSEIAYLSRIQRQVVIHYYYDGMTQDQIAVLLSIPKGTVKWHLFEARKELMKGLDSMRTITDLKFNPIQFGLMGVNGSVGTMGGTPNFFRSALSQNIAYAVYREAKTINEIADILGVSPVYVESEAEFLEEYGFLVKRPGGRYIANMLIDGEGTPAEEMILNLQVEMYEKAAKLISDTVYDELMKSGVLESGGLYSPYPDTNFLMWTILLWVLSESDTDVVNKISFEEAATIRKDGGQYIAYAGIDDPAIKKPPLFTSMKNWCGPMWNHNEDILLWQINHKWCSRKIDMDAYTQTSNRDMRLLLRFVTGDVLSAEEYSLLAEKAYITGSVGKYRLNLVWVKNEETKEKLLEIGTRIKSKYQRDLEELKSKFIQVVLDNTPGHLKKAQAFGLQYIFKADGWFLLYSVKELLDTERLKPVPEEQRPTLTMLMVTKQSS